MKRIFTLILAGAMLLSACSAQIEPIEKTPSESTKNEEAVHEEAEKFAFNGTTITLSDEEILVNGESASTEETAAVYVANDIVFYLEGQDFTYGEGTADDEHSQEEADKHTVVHITQPGDYSFEGTLSAGQIAVDLGEDAEENPDAIVNLYLNGIDITCSVAPAVIFYNVYECGSTDTETATQNVDTSAAGANVFLVDGTENNVNGSYVARIYKSVELSADGKSVIDSKKLHKYDAAFYSKRSMNIHGDTGILNIVAENEGLDSELHLTINGGVINIDSGNDGINTNEDYVSVTTINGGEVNINVNGSTGEGDGIDSNGWLVINGGKVLSSACGFSGDAGIDSDMGIHVNGGIVMASGNMYDRLEEGSQNYAVFAFASKQSGGQTYSFRNKEGLELSTVTPENDFMYLILSDPDLTEGTYTLWCGETQLAYSGNSDGMMGGFGGGMRPNIGNGEAPQIPEGMTPPEGMKEPKEMENMMKPKDFTLNEDGSITLPDGTTLSKEEMETQMKNHDFGDRGNKNGRDSWNPQEGSNEVSTEFMIEAGANFFSGVVIPTETNENI